MEICAEMQKLREYLDAHGIEWRDNSDAFSEWWMCRTKFEINGSSFSVINGVGSYGGVNAGCKHNQGLLELWINEKGEPTGYLKVEDVIKEIENVQMETSAVW